MITRRGFLTATSAAAMAAGFSTRTAAQDPLAGVSAGARDSRVTFAIDDHRVRFFSPAVREPVRLVVVADTHLFRDDERGAAYHAFSSRMARAYNRTTHVRTGDPTNPETAFDEALAFAREQRADLVALAGDTFSFPSEAAVEWALGRLQTSGLPYVYTAGNHDWHYEGLPGSLDDLRRTWIGQRLRPLYQDQDPWMGVRQVKGVRVVTIDNSTYGIQPAQLTFFRAQVATGAPLILIMHIPMYAPGRPVSYGCGHPEWGAASDRNFDLERRPRWPEGGHTEVTMTFRREVLATPNLIGVLAGHIHKPSVDVMNGVPQVVTAANAEGGFLDVEVLPGPA